MRPMDVHGVRGQSSGSGGRFPGTSKGAVTSASLLRSNKCLTSSFVLQFYDVSVRASQRRIRAHLSHQTVTVVTLP